MKENTLKKMILVALISSLPSLAFALTPEDVLESQNELGTIESQVEESKSLYASFGADFSETTPDDPFGGVRESFQWNDVVVSIGALESLILFGRNEITELFKATKDLSKNNLDISWNYSIIPFPMKFVSFDV
jgi:hypothetical protein